MLYEVSAENMAWAAGLFEGEGSIILDKGEGRRLYATPRMQMNTTDEDVALRIQKILGGRVSPCPQKPPRKHQWRWAIQGYEVVTYLHSQFSPWLGHRRNQRFREVIAACDEVRASLVK